MERMAWWRRVPVEGWLLAAVLAASLVGGTLAEAGQDEAARWSHDHPLPQNHTDEQMWQRIDEANARYDAALRPAVWAERVGLPLLAASFVALSARWTGARRPTASYVRVLGALLAGVAAVTLLPMWLDDLRGVDYFHFQAEHATQQARTALVAYTSVLLGHVIAARLRPGGSRGLRVALSWALALTVLWPLLVFAWVVPDHTTMDLVMLAVPAFAAAAMLSVILLAISGPSRIPHPLAGLEDPGLDEFRPPP